MFVCMNLPVFMYKCTYITIIYLGMYVSMYIPTYYCMYVCTIISMYVVSTFMIPDFIKFTYYDGSYTLIRCR